MPAAPPFCVQLIPAADLPAWLDDPALMAAIEFGGRTLQVQGDPRRLMVGLPRLQGPALVEVWHSREPVSQGFDGEIGFAANDEVLFGQILVDEQAFAGMEEATAHAYDAVLGFLHRHAYPHILRIWNYFPQINESAGELDRYQAFCVGRARGIGDDQRANWDVPAATAIGTRSPGLLVYFLAAAEPGTQIENPRQVSAYRYPQQYGPQTPSFSRATLKRWDGSHHLYISGTASIVGHASQHPGDSRGQLHEILTNLRALLGTAASQHGLQCDAPQRMSLLKLYLRHGEDAPAVADALREALGQTPPYLLLQGEVCRPDLVMEIEGLYAEGCPG